ncbi:hypothetical protein QAD02_002216 [Eretmocerus hayati]|uniref:Uncharacterized protein n=1 Tax=Eretmocerus hayati TaxID=131215 RepID=A0ACC2NIN2_9HYME|nr:hypothetical protein QAD02_002216 [Eretmocerus hayati]
MDNFLLSFEIDDIYWKKIRPIEVERKDRTTLQLQEGWTREINSKIWELKRLPCGFVFKEQRFLKQEGYFKLLGKCGDKTCDCTLEGTCQVSDSRKGVFKLQIKNFSKDVVHTTKLHLSGQSRKTVGYEFMAIKPTAYQHKLIIC